jgi:hypothetical protein
MAKVQKSAIELAKMIRRQLAEPNIRVAVYPNSSGWHATVYADQGSVRDLQKRVNEIARELNGLYELGP